MSDQDFTHSPAIERPSNDDKEAWVAYWIHLGQPWRTEPEIDLDRQKYLEERRQVIPDMKDCNALYHAGKENSASIFFRCFLICLRVMDIGQDEVSSGI